MTAIKCFTYSVAVPTSSDPQTTTGDRLFGLVEAYAALGDHRTGSDVDRATVVWLADRLRAIGLEVTVEPVGFDRATADAHLRVDGSEVACLPVPYEWTGTIVTEAVGVAAFDPMSGGLPSVLDDPIAAARARGAEAAVLVTEHPNGSLVGVNRVLGEPGSGFPTLLAAGRDLERRQSGRVSVDLTAQVSPGQTANIVAGNHRPGNPVVLTTPLTGWFTCAGERGTGIAVLLELVERFRHQPLKVVLTGGHELGYFGAHRWVDANPAPPAAIVHVGASIAVDAPTDTGRDLVASRLAMTSLSEESAQPVTRALQPVGLALIPSTEQWIGEGEAWSRLGVPLLSTTGAGIDFHTPEDTPERATTPLSLAVVADAMTDATAALIDIGDNGSAR